MLSPPFPLLERFPEICIRILDKRSGCTSDRGAAEAIGFPQVAYVNQVHGRDVAIVRTPVHGTIDADVLITDQADLALSLRFADCQNFVVYVPHRRIVGVIHAGWRGLAKGIITAFFEKLEAEFQVRPKDTFIGAGPSVCKARAVFTDPHRELPTHLHRFIDDHNVDLQAAADAELASLRVPAAHIERHPDCTCCNPDRYWTNRGGDREAVQAGTGRNFLVAVMMK